MMSWFHWVGRYMTASRKLLSKATAFFFRALAGSSLDGGRGLAYEA